MEAGGAILKYSNEQNHCNPRPPSVDSRLLTLSLTAALFGEPRQLIGSKNREMHKQLTSLLQVEARYTITVLRAPMLHNCNDESHEHDSLHSPVFPLSIVATQACHSYHNQVV